MLVTFSINKITGDLIKHINNAPPYLLFIQKLTSTLFKVYADIIHIIIKSKHVTDHRRLLFKKRVQGKPAQSQCTILLTLARRR